ncbi:hypothetical protein [Streptomyces sp. NPDC001502]|uniref:hypothetical protein n=1 Tax=Streptomyces sp. NPDC001502 TaxID=3364578 RepID=UPI0036783412
MRTTENTGSTPYPDPASASKARRRTSVLRRTMVLGFARGASTAFGSAAVAAALWWLRTR